jgi:rare lipoprotein A
MKQKKWIGLRAAVLAVILSSAPSTQAQQDMQQGTKHHNANLSEATTPSSDVTLSQPSQDLARSSESAELQQSDVVKVGARQSSQSAPAFSAIAKIQSHEWLGRQAATLYVRNIPVLTFLGAKVDSTGMVKMGASTQNAETGSDARTQVIEGGALTDNPSKNTPAVPQALENDPVARATAVAAQINELYREAADASKITVHWIGTPSTSKPAGDRYMIKINGKDLVSMDNTVLLPGQTKLREENVLQATNRLRRLLSNAAPLGAIADKPRPKPEAKQIALGSVRVAINGFASWYGPGFHGNLSANGEVFNQYSLTAAHRNLPFGTRVKVTNLNNGRSVVVRINDRGPYIYDRVIDLSLGAAQTIGLTSSGVAPVRLEVLN